MPDPPPVVVKDHTLIFILDPSLTDLDQPESRPSINVMEKGRRPALDLLCIIVVCVSGVWSVRVEHVFEDTSTFSLLSNYHIFCRS